MDTISTSIKTSLAPMSTFHMLFIENPENWKKLGSILKKSLPKRYDKAA